MNVVMTGRGEFVELQATGEGRPFAGHELDKLLELAGQGIQKLSEAQQDLLQMDFRARR
jgi:ribonuclease PH